MGLRLNKPSVWVEVTACWLGHAASYMAWWKSVCVRVCMCGSVFVSKCYSMKLAIDFNLMQSSQSGETRFFFEWTWRFNAMCTKRMRKFGSMESEYWWWWLWWWSSVDRGSILLSGTGWEELEEDGGKGNGRMNAWNDSWEEFLSGFKFDSREMIGW